MRYSPYSVCKFSLHRIESMVGMYYMVSFLNLYTTFFRSGPQSWWHLQNTSMPLIRGIPSNRCNRWEIFLKVQQQKVARYPFQTLLILNQTFHSLCALLSFYPKSHPPKNLPLETSSTATHPHRKIARLSTFRCSRVGYWGVRLCTSTSLGPQPKKNAYLFALNPAGFDKNPPICFRPWRRTSVMTWDSIISRGQRPGRDGELGIGVESVKMVGESGDFEVSSERFEHSKLQAWVESFLMDCYKMWHQEPMRLNTWMEESNDIAEGGGLGLCIRDGGARTSCGWMLPRLLLVDLVYSEFTWKTGQDVS